MAVWIFYTLISLSAVFWLLGLGVDGLVHQEAELLEESKKCVETKEISGRKYKRRVDEGPLSLDYGDPAIEVFHVLSLMDMKRIEYLQTCVSELEPELFADRMSAWDRNTTHGGANVTYLTGIFNQVLPDVHTKIIDAASKALKKYSSLNKRSDKPSYWDLPFSNLGIRSIQYTSFEHKQNRMSAEEKRRWRERARKDMREGADFVTFGGYPVADEEELSEDGELLHEDNIEVIPYEYDPQADEHLEEYLHSDKKGRYSLHINLSDRAHFHGGEMMVRKRLTTKQKEQSRESLDERDYTYDPNFHGILEGQDDYDDEYDEEEDLDVGEVIGVEKLTLPKKSTKKKKKKEAPGPKYNVLKSEIGRYTPERGSVIILRDDFENGMQPLVNGRRHGLRIEFWGYRDAAVGETRPEVGIPIASHWEL